MLGSPDLIIGAATFKPLDGNGGNYVASTRVFPFQNHIVVKQELTKSMRRRILVDRRLGMAESSTNPVESFGSVKLVLDLPNHTYWTGTTLRSELDIVNTLCSVANLSALLRGEQ
jgi:hypothetical protein